MCPKRRSGSIAIDTVPTPEHTARGTLSKVRDAYVLKVGRRTVKFSASPILPAIELDMLVGNEVLVAFSPKLPSIVVAITKWPRRPRVPCYWIICYIPVPDLVRRIQDQVRIGLLKQMVAEGVVAPDMAREIRYGLKNRM